jgi:hypothetical protein
MRKWEFTTSPVDERAIGRGAVMCKSSKQKLNTKSSTDAELVGASDYLPNTIWAKMFLELQGHKIKNNQFLQDNLPFATVLMSPKMQHVLRHRT